MTARQHPLNVEHFARVLAGAAARQDLIEITYLDGRTEHGLALDLDENGFALELVDGDEEPVNLMAVEGVEVIDA